MNLSAPIYILKQRAKALSRRDKVRLHVALDRVAVQEGYQAWSHLSGAWEPAEATAVVFSRLEPGELVLVGARPGQGKTLFAMGLAVEAMRRGNRAAFFSLEFTPADIAQCLAVLGRRMDEFGGLFHGDTSDDICAAYITAQLADAPPGMLIVIDYLQLLDRRRNTPELQDQVRQLRDFAAERQAIVVCVSQIDRAYDPAVSPAPGLADIRLPNPLDLSLFDKACFLQDGRVKFLAAPHASGPGSR